MTKDNTNITQLKSEQKSYGDKAKTGDNPVNLLQEAIREVRVASAERAESVADIAELNRLKLEMLGESLKDTFDEAARYPDLFDCAISSVPTPRLFVDAVTHVTMARDQKTYRVIRNTRQGRVILEESPEISVITNAVTRYMAERIVEQQTLLDQPMMSEEATPKAALVNKDHDKEATIKHEQEGPWSDFFLGLSWFLVGVIAGAAMLYLWANGYLDGATISDAASTNTN